MTETPDSLLRVTNQAQRLRGHLSADMTDVLIERLSIAIQRAKERGSPQSVEIKINDKGFVLYIDPTDHYPKVK